MSSAASEKRSPEFSGRHLYIKDFSTPPPSTRRTTVEITVYLFFFLSFLLLFFFFGQFWFFLDLAFGFIFFTHINSSLYVFVQFEYTNSLNIKGCFISVKYFSFLYGSKKALTGNRSIILAVI